MKIAYIVPYVPNLIRTRPYNLISHLAVLGHEVHVFTVGSRDADLADAQALRRKGTHVHYAVQPLWRSLWNSLAALPSRQPLQTVYSWQGQLEQRLARQLSQEHFDIVHVEHLRGSRYALSVKSRFPALPLVWDSVDCISHLFAQAAASGGGWFGRFVTRFDLERTRNAEGSLVCSFDRVLVTSATDRDALLRLVQEGRQPAPVSVLPNGVDLDYFHPHPTMQREPATIVFSGKMSYHANIAMAKYLASEIMPRVWTSNPQVRLCLVGKDPPADIKKMAGNPGIQVTGTVDDIRPFLWRATVSVTPLLYGVGIQNKILEAMATGTPVLTSTRALAALQVMPGRDLLVADGPDESAQNILRLIRDADLRQRLAQNGVDYVRQNHDWKAIALELTNLYRQTLESKKDLANK